MKYFKFIKSYDCWEEDDRGWYDLYSVDGYQYYPLSDFVDTIDIPSSMLQQLPNVIDGSKTDWEDVILSLYYDLFLKGVANGFEVDYDEWYNHNIKDWDWVEECLMMQGIVIEVVDHSVAYVDLQKWFADNRKEV